MADSPSNVLLLTLRRYRDSNQGFHEDLGDGARLTMMQIPGGTFVMGSPKSEDESLESERPQHEVSVSPFFMGRCVVTQEQWRVVAGYDQVDRELDQDPSHFKGANRPVERVSWDEAQEFCRRLSIKTGRDYRLPSEAEWEYACRAGSAMPFHFGETINSSVANYRGNYVYGEGAKGEDRQETTEVGIFPANEWGLQDMHGNVWEWCEDGWHETYEEAPNDGSAWVYGNSTSSPRKLLRGGSWRSYPADCRSAFRYCILREVRDYNIGFRVVCSL